MKFSHPRNQEVLDLFGEHRYVTLSGGGNFSSKSFVVSDVLDQYPDLNKLVWVVNDFGEQEAVARALHDWSALEVEILEDEGTYPSLVRVISSLQDPHRKVAVILTSARLLKLFPDHHQIEQTIQRLKVGDEISPVNLFESLIESGYEVSEDSYLEPGFYLRHGDVLDVFPINSKHPYRVEFDFETILAIYAYDQTTQTKIHETKSVAIYPLKTLEAKSLLWDFLGAGTLFVEDELDLNEGSYESVSAMIKKRPNDVGYLLFTSFLEEDNYHHHLHYLSVLKYQNKLDFIENMKEKMYEKWRVYLFTKNKEELKSLFADRNISILDDPSKAEEGEKAVVFFELGKDQPFPHAFQNPHLKFALLTDREILGLRDTSHKDPSQHAVYLDFLTGLKMGDYVVHSDHGIALFRGLDKRTIDEVTREYLRLDYAENDRLFVPIDQADKVSKFIGSGDQPPRLTRLGSSEWVTITNKVKKETQ
ncbi:MAG: CarD family transcriptional regulator, partial [Candidatus Gracilibacteria bacterium]